MPWIIDYPAVVEQASVLGLECLYPNSGAFGFGEKVATYARGWIGPADPTIRPAALALTRGIPEPYEPTLASMFVRAWRAHFPGRVWLLPKSHWHYELNFGSVPWLGATLEHVDLDPGQLQERNNGSAIEFEPDEPDQAAYVVQKLMENLMGSDFAAVFPDHPVIATLHHHKQVWWTTTRETIASALDAI